MTSEKHNAPFRRYLKVHGGSGSTHLAMCQTRAFNLCDAAEQPWDCNASLPDSPKSRLWMSRVAASRTGGDDPETRRLLRSQSESNMKSPARLILFKPTGFVGQKDPAARDSQRGLQRASSAADCSAEQPSFDEIKRKWRSHQIEAQTRLAKAQRPWWCRWLVKQRGALDVVHRRS